VRRRRAGRRPAGERRLAAAGAVVVVAAAARPDDEPGLHRRLEVLRHGQLLALLQLQLVPLPEHRDLPSPSPSLLHDASFKRATEVKNVTSNHRAHHL